MDSLIPKIRSIPSKRGASTALAAVLRDELRRGGYKPGEKLMPQRQISDISNLGYSTVNRAISTLIHEGLVESRKGAGTFVCDNTATASDTPGGEAIEYFKAFTLVVPALEPGIYASLQHGFCDEASKTRHQVVVCCSNEDMNKQSDAVLQLLDQRVAGVALAPLPGSPPYLVRTLQEAGIPVVQLNHTIEGVKSPVVTLSFQKLGHMAARVLADHHHRRIAIIGSHCGETVERYSEGFRSGFKQLGVDPEILSAFSHYPEPGWHDDLRRLVDEMLDSPTPPTAFFALFDDVAEMIYLAAANRGLRIPEDFSLISFGGSSSSGVLGGLISTVTGDEAWAGRKTIALLHEMAENKRPLQSCEQFDIPLKFFRGETVAPAK